MKTKLLIAALAVVLALGFTSCTTSQGGCKMSAGMVGYK